MKKLIWLLFLLWANEIAAQEHDPMYYANNLLYQSGLRWTNAPEPAALGRYGEYPVDYATGIPDITIPVYTLTCGSLQVPITLSYHMGGNKVDDRESSVGLGWSLRAGGNISRSIRGIADDNAYFSNRTGFLTEPVTSTPELSNGQKHESIKPYPTQLPYPI